MQDLYARSDRMLQMKEDSFKDFVLDQLQGMPEVSCRAMFGGHGLYSGKIFFGILHQGRLYFKTDSTNRTAYLDQGMKPFRPNPRQTLKNYYEVPVELIEDPDRLILWAREAIQIAERKP